MTDGATTNAATTITVDQWVPAPPEAVYAAWIDPARLATWWWPHLPDTVYELDVRVGGRYWIRSATAGIGVHGTYRRLQPPERIELGWTWDGWDEGIEETVEVTFSAEGTGTRVTVRHAVVDKQEAADFARGWSDCLARLGSGT